MQKFHLQCFKYLRKRVLGPIMKTVITSKCCRILQILLQILTWEGETYRLIYKSSTFESPRVNAKHFALGFCFETTSLHLVKQFQFSYCVRLLSVTFHPMYRANRSDF